MPNDFATISLIPKTSQIALIGPPAIIPVPLMQILIILYQIHLYYKHRDELFFLLLKEFLLIFFLNISLAFLIASGTCLALA